MPYHPIGKRSWLDAYTPTIFARVALFLLLVLSITTISQSSAHAATATSYEAESSANTLAGGAVIATCSTCSGGQDVGYIGQGGTLQFKKILASSAGTYAVTIYYVDGDAGRSAQMSVNGGASTTITFPGTNDYNWDFVQSLTVSVNLKKSSTNTIMFSNASAYAPDIDRITTTNSSPTSSVLVSPSTLSLTPNSTAHVGVYLSAQPAGNVTITSAISGASGVSITSGASLTFTTANWNTQQTVTIAASSSAVVGSTATLTASANGYTNATSTITIQGSGGGQQEPACAPGLPANTGTNYPTPNDPNGFGFADQSIVGWEGNTYAPFTYLSGSFFARGVTASTYTTGGTSYCGAMYSFGAYTYGLNGGAPATGSVQWTMDSGYLPALTTSFTRNNVAISIKNFADNVTINGNPFELVYSRVAVTNNGSSAVTIDPQPSSGLTALNSTSNTVQPGQTANHDYVVAVDSFGAGLLLPSGSALTSAAPALDTAYSQMSSYWNGRLAAAPTLSLPNLTLPNTNNLSNPGTALGNAYKSAFIYTRIIQVGTAPFSGANNYDSVFNHDAPGILVNRFTLGDFQDAHSLLLNARPSENNPYYYDGVLKTPWAWAIYLYETGDTSFVSQYFHDDASGSSPYGPSLYTMMHTIPGNLNSAGYIGVTGDNDSSGTWLFDDYSAMLGLASYKYIATQIGNTTEATWADQQLTSLINNTNAGLAANQQANNFSYLSCEVNVPDSADRCNTPTDSNWAANTFFGQDPWDITLMGGNPTGLIGSPTQIDNTYAFGYGRLQGTLPYPTAGAFTGYSTAYNTTYAQGAFLGTRYRDLALTSYAWQIATTTNGPNAWWEADGSLSSGNPWAGSHANPEFGAIPYAWPLAGQTLALIDAIASQGFTTTTGGSSFSYTPMLSIGRGIPDTWIANGQTISIGNYHTGNGQSSATFGVSISTALNSSSKRIVTVTLTGTPPSGTISIGLPAFIDSGVSQAQGGTYNASDHTVTVTPGTTSISIILNS